MVHDRVLIVGAGPVGLVAATYLVSEGIPVTVLETSRELPEDLRASTFHPPTLDMLDRFGVADDCIKQGLICPEWQFRDRQEGPVITFNMALLAKDTRHPYRLQCEQWKLTRLLRAKLEHAGTEIIYNVSATGYEQDADGVTVTVAHEDGSTEKYTGRYLIGADGARSTIRKSMGTAFDGMTIPEIYLSMSTPYSFGENIPGLSNIAYISDPDEWVVLLRTPTLWRVLLPTDPSLSEEDIKRDETIQSRLQKLHPTGQHYDIAHCTAYRVHERVAQHYVQGRVFLAGDAAHLNNPLGGMGMNGGLHDAMNLSEKLVQVWKGAPLSLMGRYERQRRKVATETVQAQALRNRQMLNERDPAARRAYHDSLRALAQDHQAQREYLMRSSMLQSLRDLESVE